MKYITSILTLNLLLCFPALGQNRGRNAGTGATTITTRRDYGDTYAIFNSRGEIVALYTKNCSYISCTPVKPLTGTITEVQSSGSEIYGFRVQYSNGKSGTWGGLLEELGGLGASGDRNLVGSLVGVGKQVRINSCGCGSGNISAIASIETLASVPEQTPRDSRYFLRLFNCDDGCKAQLNGNVIYLAGFGQDTGWLDITEALQPLRNEFTFSVHNEGGAIAYGFQLRKNEKTLYEGICGRAGIVGCANNRPYQRGYPLTFVFQFETISRDEIARSNANWPKFWAAFQVSVRKHDRKALISMMSDPFGCANEEISPADCLRNLVEPGSYVSWKRIASAVRAGTKLDGETRRISFDDYLAFELGKDGKWRWSAIWGSD